MKKNRDVIFQNKNLKENKTLPQKDLFNHRENESVNECLFKKNLLIHICESFFQLYIFYPVFINEKCASQKPMKQFYHEREKLIIKIYNLKKFSS